MFWSLVFLTSERAKAGHLMPPGFLAVEVVSPQQGGLFNKAQTYAAWGVEHVWIVDPETRECFEYHGGDQFLKVETLLTAGSPSVAISDGFDRDAV